MASFLDVDRPFLLDRSSLALFILYGDSLIVTDFSGLDL